MKQKQSRTRAGQVFVDDLDAHGVTISFEYNQWAAVGKWGAALNLS